MAISVFQLLASQGLLRFARNDSLLGLFTALSTLFFMDDLLILLFDMPTAHDYHERKIHISHGYKTVCPELVEAR